MKRKLPNSTFNKSVTTETEHALTNIFGQKYKLQEISGKVTEFHYNCLNFTKVLKN